MPQIVAKSASKHLSTRRQVQVQDFPIARNAVMHHRTPKPKPSSTECTATGCDLNEVSRRGCDGDTMIHVQPHRHTGKFDEGVVNAATRSTARSSKLISPSRLECTG